MLKYITLLLFLFACDFPSNELSTPDKLECTGGKYFECNSYVAEGTNDIILKCQTHFDYITYATCTGVMTSKYILEGQESRQWNFTIRGKQAHPTSITYSKEFDIGQKYPVRTVTFYW